MTAAEKQYGDMIHMERPMPEDTLRLHPRMPLEKRAKIFAPFQALRGYDQKLGNAARKTARVRHPEHSEEEERILSQKVQQAKPGTEVTITYFIPDDPLTELGYITEISGQVIRTDLLSRTIFLKNPGSGQEYERRPDIPIPLDDITDIVGPDISVSENICPEDGSA